MLGTLQSLKKWRVMPWIQRSCFCHLDYLRDKRGPRLALLESSFTTSASRIRSLARGLEYSHTTDRLSLQQQVEVYCLVNAGDIPDSTIVTHGDTKAPFACSSSRDPDSGICHRSRRRNSFPTTGSDGISKQSPSEPARVSHCGCEKQGLLIRPPPKESPSWFLANRVRTSRARLGGKGVFPLGKKVPVRDQWESIFRRPPLRGTWYCA